jgi:hypothetical protein
MISYSLRCVLACVHEDTLGHPQRFQFDSEEKAAAHQMRTGLQQHRTEKIDMMPETSMARDGLVSKMEKP